MSPRRRSEHSRAEAGNTGANGRTGEPSTGAALPELPSFGRKGPRYVVVGRSTFFARFNAGLTRIRKGAHCVMCHISLEDQPRYISEHSRGGYGAHGCLAFYCYCEQCGINEIMVRQ